MFRANNSVISTGQCSDILRDDGFMRDYEGFLRSKYSVFYRFDALS